MADVSPRLKHDAVRRALEKEGWTIVFDPLTMRLDGRFLYVDLVAEKDGVQIAVEVKGDALELSDLEKAVGQFVIYRHVIERKHGALQVWLALPLRAYNAIWTGAEAQDLRQNLGLNLLVFDAQKEEIIQWILNHSRS